MGALWGPPGVASFSAPRQRSVLHSERDKGGAVDLVGRQWEMAGADRFLDAVSAGPAALVLEGEPGIGKSTVWRAAVDAAQRRSYRVLVCRASETEGALSFSVSATCSSAVGRAARASSRAPA